MFWFQYFYTHSSQAIVGAFGGGWLADRVGRINGVFFAAIFALVGGALQSATQSADFILVARVVTGLGTGALTAIVPVYIAEVSASNHRGGFLGELLVELRCELCANMLSQDMYSLQIISVSRLLTGWILVFHLSTMVRTLFPPKEVFAC